MRLFKRSCILAMNSDNDSVTPGNEDDTRLVVVKSACNAVGTDECLNVDSTAVSGSTMNFEDAFEGLDMHVFEDDFNIDTIDDKAVDDDALGGVAVTMVDDDSVITGEDSDVDESVLFMDAGGGDDEKFTGTDCDDVNGIALYDNAAELVACEGEDDGDDVDAGLDVSIDDEEGKTVDEEDDDSSDISPDDNDSNEEGDDGEDTVGDGEDNVCNSGVEGDVDIEVFFMGGNVEKLFALAKDVAVEGLGVDEGEVTCEDGVSLLGGSAIGVSFEAGAVDGAIDDEFGDVLMERIGFVLDDKADDVDGACNSVFGVDDDKLNLFMEGGSGAKVVEDNIDGLNAHE
ncbi:hypothetical protein GOP47_0018321 [Adiantum capillus-veneris]|uniref:Uncharacterized protein n=1 Tax=Adiantum capillus-veneris TaxID=13818 RepID=A0A9D4ZA09_ADICA|nr:hypothetical protein GOP47_0018321 [Adiantum capillus-veneris]